MRKEELGIRFDIQEDGISHFTKSNPDLERK
jgi:hypothetical protein